MKSLWRVPSQQAQPSSSLLWVSSQPPSGQRGGNTWYFKMCPFAVKSHKNSIHNEQNKNALKTKPACGYLLDEAVSFSLFLFFFSQGRHFVFEASWPRLLGRVFAGWLRAALRAGRQQPLPLAKHRAAARLMFPCHGMAQRSPCHCKVVLFPGWAAPGPSGWAVSCCPLLGWQLCHPTAPRGLCAGRGPRTLCTSSAPGMCSACRPATSPMAEPGLGQVAAELNLPLHCSGLPEAARLCSPPTHTATPLGQSCAG